MVNLVEYCGKENLKSLGYWDKTVAPSKFLALDKRALLNIVQYKPESLDSLTRHLIQFFCHN